jgi:hypothetical protein
MGFGANHRDLASIQPPPQSSPYEQEEALYTIASGFPGDPVAPLIGSGLNTNANL